VSAAAAHGPRERGPQARGGDAMSFTLPARLEAAEPPPVRDEVRLLVARPGRPLVHARFLDLADHLEPGDLLVVNASATLPAALPARRTDGSAVELHLSTPASEAAMSPSGVGREAVAHPDRWVVEVRRNGRRTRATTETLALPAGGTATLLAPYLAPGRLWIARLDLPEPLEVYLNHHGAPIRYAHEPVARPLSDHQTIFATEPGSAEMPSAGRPFTKRALTRLRERGIGVQRIVLHTGVSSQERGERPYPERYKVPAHTAARVNAARSAGHRVIAVGTTVVRALETTAEDERSGGEASDQDRCTVRPGEGWTSLTVTPERGVHAVDGLLTGWHEPEASHLLMLEAFAGRKLLERSYASAVANDYRWHEFGDLHLLLR
jgi:S-adenosylmethionine:tRNA ribosyltransferase-isomerase